MEDIVLERLHIDTVQRDQAVGSHYINIGGDNSVRRWDISCEPTEVGRCLLQVSEMLSEKLDGVLRPVLEKEGNGLLEVGSDVLSLQVVLRGHVLLGLRVVGHLLIGDAGAGVGTRSHGCVFQFLKSNYNNSLI